MIRPGREYIRNIGEERHGVVSEVEQKYVISQFNYPDSSGKPRTRNSLADCSGLPGIAVKKGRKETELPCPCILVSHLW